MNRIITSRDYNGSNYKVGAKAREIHFLGSKGFLCPEFYLLDYITLVEINSSTLILKELLSAWIDKNNISSEKLWAVRSSTQEEDGDTKSFAGLFRTELNVRTDALETAILSVYNSYFEFDNQQYFTGQKADFGIIIQEMINPDYSGVIFSHNPSDVRDDTVLINVIPGLGENLVSGKEEGFLAKYIDGHISFDENSGAFSGEVYRDGLVKVSKTQTEIQEELKKHWNTLSKGAKRLSKLKACAVDIEFCVSDNKVYWLQVRPITTGKDEPFIWDNTASEGNYPGLILPLSISLIENSFSKAYRGLASYLGMPKKLLKKNKTLINEMIGEINGGLYYNVTAWQKLICQLPFGRKISQSLPSVWGMESSEFYPEKVRSSWYIKTVMLVRLLFSILFLNSIKNKYVRKYNLIQDKIDKAELHKKSYGDLVELYKELERKMIDNWEAPLLNNLFTVVTMLISRKVVGGSKIAMVYPNFINDSLFAQSDVVSVKIVNEFKNIINEIKNDNETSEIFENHNVENIFLKLKKNKLGLFDKIDQYIKDYGDRSDEPELKMETVTYKENPLKFISYLKENLSYGFDERKSKKRFDYKAVIKEQYKWNIPKRLLLLLVVKQTIKRVTDRESFRFMRTRTYGLVRRIFRAIDAKLLADGLIASQNDSLYLKLEELLNPETTVSFIDIIKIRKEIYSGYNKSGSSTRYIQIRDQFNEAKAQVFDDSDTTLKGTGCCSGIVRAKVRIFDNDTSEIEDADDNIYIANYFEPGKLGLFSQAAGLISARGNLLGHTAILCREMGIPSIVGAKTILNRVKDGDVIEMNGSTGQIEIISTDE